MKFSFWLIAFWLVALALCSQLLGNSENAVLVINANSASSKLIANHYIKLRNIPAENVIFLEDVPEKDVLEVELFREKILQPVLAAIDQRKLSNHIDYVIYSAGFPTVIDAQSDRAKYLESLTQQNNGNPGQLPFQPDSMFAPAISLTSATYFYRQVLSRDVGYLSLTANTYYRSPSQLLLASPFVGDDAKTFNEAIAQAKNENVQAAIDQLLPLAEKHPLQLAVLYWLARTYASLGDVENTVLWLKRSMAVGWQFRDATETDRAFRKLKDNESVRSLISMIPETPYRYAPSYGFDSAFGWGPNGMVNSTADQGNRYLLSTILGVTSNQGNTEKEVLAYLQSSTSADSTRPSGRFYFTRTKNVRTTTRSQGIDEAIEELELLGFQCQVVPDDMPSNRPDILGLAMGTGGFDWSHSQNVIVPGAICENLTSYGGRLFGRLDQTKMSEFLRYGAAGTSGTVTEPYAIAQKFPHPRIHVHYVRGCTLAEAFYQSVYGPFQLLIVGDALCKPWAGQPELSVTGDIVANTSVKDTITFQLDGSNSPFPVRMIEFYLNGSLVRQIESNRTGEVKLDTRTLADGFHELRFVAVSQGPISSRRSTILPLTIDNEGHAVQLSANSHRVAVEDEIELRIQANGSEEMQLIHCGRSLKKIDGDSAEFKLPAYAFGRGPVRLQAVAKFGEKYVRSAPLELEITGSISSDLPPALFN